MHCTSSVRVQSTRYTRPFLVLQPFLAQRYKFGRVLDSGYVFLSLLFNFYLRHWITIR